MKQGRCLPGFFLAMGGSPERSKIPIDFSRPSSAANGFHRKPRSISSSERNIFSAIRASSVSLVDVSKKKIR